VATFEVESKWPTGYGAMTVAKLPAVRP
jgi:hypothetical protein